MKPRNSLNSEVLKNRFPDVYREFFSKCQLVVSAPHFFTWAGEYTGNWGGMVIMQKIPLRIYIGLELIPISKSQNRISIEDDAKSYSIKECRFKQDRYEHPIQQRLLKFLNDNYSQKKKNQNIKLHILSELPLGGSGSISALSSILASLLALKNRDIAFKDIQKWKDCSSQDLIKKKSLKFDSVFRLAWKISNICQGEYINRAIVGASVGATVFNVLLPSNLPVFYSIIRGKNTKLSLDIEENYEILDQIPILGGRIEELFDFKEIPSWPIDFALVSLEEPRGTSHFSTQELQEAFSKTNKFINKNLREFFLLKKIPNPIFGHKNNDWQAILQVMNATSVHILMKMGELLKEGNREDALRIFLRAIDKHQILFLLLGFNSPQVNAVDSIIHQETYRIDDLGAGVKTVSTTKKGVILFATSRGRLEQIIEPIISRVKKELKLNLNIIYASWLDGIETEGTKIEQDLEQEIYSDFISKNTVYVRDFTQKNPVNLLLSPEEFEQRKKQIDLLLVENEGKIYVKGHSLTSKKLHSKKATIKLLKILLEQKGKEIFNNEFPVSSYAKDRYELQSKIVIPLLRTIQKRTKKKLDLKIKGGIVNFSLQLNPGQVKIWLVS